MRHDASFIKTSGAGNWINLYYWYMYSDLEMFSRLGAKRSKWSVLKSISQVSSGKHKIFMHYFFLVVFGEHTQTDQILYLSSVVGSRCFMKQINWLHLNLLQDWFTVSLSYEKLYHIWQTFLSFYVSKKKNNQPLNVNYTGLLVLLMTPWPHVNSYKTTQ